MTKILNPELRKEACCGYGDWFALDLLVELWTTNLERGETVILSKTCPSCGARVTVDWNAESVSYEPKSPDIGINGGEEDGD